MQEEHHPVADFELCDRLILQHILQLVCLQGPDSVGVLLAVLGNDLLINFIELDEIRPSEREISEQLPALEFPRHELQVLRVLLRDCPTPGLLGLILIFFWVYLLRYSLHPRRLVLPHEVLLRLGVQCLLYEFKGDRSAFE